MGGRFLVKELEVGGAVMVGPSLSNKLCRRRSRRRSLGEGRVVPPLLLQLLMMAAGALLSILLDTR